jgi:8-oxo-dGTP pyrophosphatase MutT (NUDIX family)
VIIDIHGHYTTAPAQLGAWRDVQIAFAEGQGDAPDIAALRISDDAIRETIEEVGVAVGFAPPLEQGIVRNMQERLRAEEPFSAVLADLGLVLQLDALMPFARWCPVLAAPRRFDTFFFLAEAPDDAAELLADDREVTRAFWAGAGEILKDADAGRAHIIFPTRRNLERLALLRSIEEARAHIAAYPIQLVVPWI